MEVDMRRMGLCTRGRVSIRACEHGVRTASGGTVGRWTAVATWSSSSVCVISLSRAGGGAIVAGGALSSHDMETAYTSR